MISISMSDHCKGLILATLLVIFGATVGGSLVALFGFFNRSASNRSVSTPISESASHYNRDHWDFNSSAARKRLNCTADEHVDHIVSLKEAFDSGASTWSLARKAKFANDPINQHCLGATLNLSKSDGDLAEWNGGDCALRKRIANITNEIKGEYGLETDPAEANAIRVAINKIC